MEWIDVRDKPPPQKQTVLVWHDDNGLGEWDVGVGYLENNVWVVWGFGDYSYNEINYWMPTPTPPNK
jgi:hypothetical protein